MNEQLGEFMEKFCRLYDYVEALKITNPETTVSIKIFKNTISKKEEICMDIYVCVEALKMNEKMSLEG